MLSTSSCRCVADFAILELREAVNDIELAVLAEESPKTGDAVTKLTGHPVTQLSDSDLLLKVGADVISAEDCNKSWDDINPITRNMICTKPVLKGSTCNGDSGGPVILQATGELVALNLWGYHDCTSEPHPNVASDLPEKLAWIKANSM
ncbi:hypothetical protein K4F52_003935 [Lecanicillium sp. MT-2017a]|nr:hypothetical protein K4F52_003935 [Lecanicillium sp. MT-2017a]